MAGKEVKPENVIETEPEKKARSRKRKSSPESEEVPA
jgi:hypothetical protein